ncbi:hypothetical protein CDD80_1228 [Ophiocordyceps camponoti-rufipedis]|uniref:Uncharacterized protein n=1 Tax=Ophiocordyceps camponoti-rufipedis TaxID=2004952 RepID=A0A2C5YFC9_9HYPO|nr:hypothetical protein CDD80_1228 [Ophiocordyceps camponoti-rufipedis]
MQAAAFRDRVDAVDVLKRVVCCKGRPVVELHARSRFQSQGLNGMQVPEERSCMCRVWPAQTSSAMPVMAESVSSKQGLLYVCSSCVLTTLRSTDAEQTARRNGAARRWRQLDPAEDNRLARKRAATGVGRTERRRRYTTYCSVARRVSGQGSVAVGCRHPAGDGWDACDAASMPVCAAGQPREIRSSGMPLCSKGPIQASS